MTQSKNQLSAYLFSAEYDPQTATELLRFRKTLFVDKLGWDLNTDGQLEVDQFDIGSTIYAALFSDSEIVGTFRAIRTDEPYLAASVFPDLASEIPYPSRTDYWEISRFGINASERYFTIADMLYALMFYFALSRAAQSLVAVTDLVHERYLAKRQIRTRRYGKPRFYPGADGLKGFTLVAGEIMVRDQDPVHLQNLLDKLNGVAINDKTLVLGRRRIPA